MPIFNTYPEVTSIADNDLSLVWKDSEGKVKTIKEANARKPIVAKADTIALLKALDVSYFVTGGRVSVLGYTTSNDGGGGEFYYDSASAATVNNGTVFSPNVGVGRWLRIFSGSLNVKWFGVVGDGVTNDSVKMQVAVTAGISTGQSVFVPVGNYVLNSTLNIDFTGYFSSTTIQSFRFYGDGTGSILTSNVAGTAIKVTVPYGINASLISIENLRLECNAIVTKGIEIVGDVTGIVSSLLVKISGCNITVSTVPGAGTAARTGIHSSISYGLQIERNFINSFTTAIKFTQGQNSWNVHNNWIQNFNIYGINLDGTGGAINNGTINSNYFNATPDGTNTAIDCNLLLTDSINIINNRFEDSAGGKVHQVQIGVGGVTINTVLQGNHFSPNAVAGTYCLVEGTGARFTQDLGNSWPVIELTLSDATNASPIVVTTTAAHNLADNDYISVAGVVGNINANGTWYVDVLSPTTFALHGAPGATSPSFGTAAYVSGGTVFNIRQNYNGSRKSVSARRWPQGSGGTIGRIGLESPGGFLVGRDLNAQSTPIFYHCGGLFKVAGAVAVPGAVPGKVIVTLTVLGAIPGDIPIVTVCTTPGTTAFAVPTDYIAPQAYVSGYDTIKVFWTQITGAASSVGSDLTYAVSVIRNWVP